LVGRDRHPLGDQILLDHLLELVGVVVLGVAALGEDVGVEVGLALELGDAAGGEVGVAQLVGGVLQELGLGVAGIHALRREVVPLVAQVADQFGGEYLVEDLDYALAVGAVGVGDRTLVDVLARPLAKCLHVGKEVAHVQRPSSSVGWWLMSASWTPSTWRARPASQQPEWPDEGRLDDVPKRLATPPPLG